MYYYIHTRVTTYAFFGNSNYLAMKGGKQSSAQDGMSNYIQFLSNAV